MKEVTTLQHLAITFGWSALFIAFYVSAWFALSLVLDRADVADVAWGLGPVLLSWWLVLLARSLLLVPVAILVSLWGVRLSLHVARRDFAPGVGEDPRYAAWRATWRFFALRSYVQIFLLQGLFMLLVSSPLIVLAAARGESDFTLAVLGGAIFAAGYVFETTADRQLDTFLAIADNHGHVMDKGLWAWSRHPNYFGESLVWWGLAVIALGVPYGWIGLVGPTTITVLLVFVSGIPLVERRHAGEPEWEAYKQRTSSFLPMPPHKE